jgi:capsular polysaccharide biosynthesis protein
MDGNNGLPGRVGAYAPHDDFTADEDWPADAATGLVSLAFLKAAIGRSAMFCCIMAVVGLLVGCGIYVKFPAPYKASTTLLITYGPYESATSGPNDDQAIAQTRAVATLVMHELGLQQPVNKVQAAYSVTVASTRVLQVTFSAPSATKAINGAKAVATAFLQFRARLLQQEQAQVVAALEQQVSQATQLLSSIKTQISQVSAQSASTARQSRLSGLRAERTRATTALTNIQNTVSGNEAAVQPATAAAIRDSQVLDAAALLPRSHLRHLVLYPGLGLIAVGISLVLIRALLSDRPRRRDDVAAALGAPVRLSAGRLRPNRRRLVRRRRGAAQKADIRRIAEHLGRAVPQDGRGIAALAVVAVDDSESAALPLVSLATACAQGDVRVVLADLADGAPAAKLLGAAKPGVSVVSVHDAPFILAVPEHDDVAPAGPLGELPPRDQRSSFTDAVAAACDTANLLLTLVTLDPSFGGEHLPTWAADAVVVITAGQSSWTKINAVGEMIRLSGTQLVSAVLVGADRADESLGLAPAQQANRADDGLGLFSAQQTDHAAEITEQGAHPDATDLMLAVGDTQSRRRSTDGDTQRR